jgi:hypothetical protein
MPQLQSGRHQCPCAGSTGGPGQWASHGSAGAWCPATRRLGSRRGQLNRAGHLKLMLPGRHKVNEYAHRLVCWAAIGPPPEVAPGQAPALVLAQALGSQVTSPSRADLSRVGVPLAQLQQPRQGLQRSKRPLGLLGVQLPTQGHTSGGARRLAAPESVQSGAGPSSTSSPGEGPSHGSTR